MTRLVNTESISFPKAFWLYGVGFLTCLYFAAFVLVYTSWGRTFGLSIPAEFRDVKIALVTVACFGLIGWVYRVIWLAGQSYEGSRTYVGCAKAFVVAATVVLFFGTPLIALSLGASYR